MKTNDFEFEREPAEKETEEVKKDVKESAFIGVWKADNVDFEGISSTPGYPWCVKRICGNPKRQS